MYDFKELISKNKGCGGMCRNCRYRYYFQPPFGTGWVACDIITDDEKTFANAIADIPLEIRNNCPGFEKKTLFSWVKKPRPRIIYQEVNSEDKVLCTD